MIWYYIRINRHNLIKRKSQPKPALILILYIPNQTTPPGIIMISLDMNDRTFINKINLINHKGLIRSLRWLHDLNFKSTFSLKRCIANYKCSINFSYYSTFNNRMTRHEIHTNQSGVSMSNHSTTESRITRYE